MNQQTGEKKMKTRLSHSDLPKHPDSVLLPSPRFLACPERSLRSWPRTAPRSNTHCSPYVIPWSFPLLPTRELWSSLQGIVQRTIVFPGTGVGRRTQLEIRDFIPREVEGNGYQGTACMLSDTCSKSLPPPGSLPGTTEPDS